MTADAAATSPAGMSPQDIIAFAQDRIRAYIGTKWEIVAVSMYPGAALTRIHVVDTSEWPEQDIYAFVPIEVAHPAAIVAAVILQWRLRYDQAARECIDATFGDEDDEDDDIDPPHDDSERQRRYDA